MVLIRFTLDMFILPFLFPYVLFLRIFFLPVFPSDFLSVNLHAEWFCKCCEIKSSASCHTEVINVELILADVMLTNKMHFLN